MKKEDTPLAARVAALTDEQIETAQSKSRLYGSTLQMELKLAAGETLFQCYGGDDFPHREREPRPNAALLEAEAKVIGCRMASELMSEFGRKLTREELYSLSKAAIIIAALPVWDREEKEKYAIDSAFRMATGA
jgi:hypothetical protein